MFFSAPKQKYRAEHKELIRKYLTHFYPGTLYMSSIKREGKPSYTNKHGGPDVNQQINENLRKVLRLRAIIKRLAKIFQVPNSNNNNNKNNSVTKLNEIRRKIRHKEINSTMFKQNNITKMQALLNRKNLRSTEEFVDALMELIKKINPYVAYDNHISNRLRMREAQQKVANKPRVVRNARGRPPPPPPRNPNHPPSPRSVLNRQSSISSTYSNGTFSN
jgi:hypothetical protein